MVNEYQVGEYQLIDFGEEIKLQVMITKDTPWPVHGLLIESRRLHVTFAGGEDFPAWDDGESQFTLQERHDAVVNYEPSNADGLAELHIGLGSNDLIMCEVEQVDPVERAALRIAAYELRLRPDVPYRVVINEAIETVKRFGAEHGHTYVNGVLDHAAAAWRAVEVGAGRSR